jgi:hypothetical protein
MALSVGMRSAIRSAGSRASARVAGLILEFAARGELTASWGGSWDTYLVRQRPVLAYSMLRRVAS